MPPAGGFADGVDYGTSTTFGVDCGCEDPAPSSTPQPTPAILVINPAPPSPEETPSPNASTGEIPSTSPPIPFIVADDDEDEKALTVEDNETGAAAVNRPIFTWSVATAAAAAATVMAVAVTGGAY